MHDIIDHSPIDSLVWVCLGKRSNGFQYVDSLVWVNGVMVSNMSQIGYRTNLSSPPIIHKPFPVP
jgi:hypothetical protein